MLQGPKRTVHTSPWPRAHIFCFRGPYFRLIPSPNAGTFEVWLRLWHVGGQWVHVRDRAVVAVRTCRQRAICGSIPFGSYFSVGCSRARSSADRRGPSKPCSIFRTSARHGPVRVPVRSPRSGGSVATIATEITKNVFRENQHHFKLSSSSSSLMHHTAAGCVWRSFASDPTARSQVRAGPAAQERRWAVQDPPGIARIGGSSPECRLQRVGDSLSITLLSAWA